MATLRRVRVALSGFPGGPGVTTYYTLDTGTFLPSLRTMYAGFAGSLPTNTTVKIEAFGDEINDVNGNVTGAWTGDPQTEVVGTDAGLYAAPCGLTLQWNTATIVDGRRLRGRSYLVPIGANAYQNDGSINSASRAAILAIASTFQNEQDSSFVIWHRPREAKPADGSRPAVTQRDGSSGLVTSVAIPDRVAVLTSRRN